MDTTPTPASEVIAAALKETADADRAWYAALGRAPSWEVARLWKRVETAAAAATALQDQARKAFAQSRGWTYNRRGWWMEYPEIDHAEFYDSPYRRTVGIVSHTYADRSQITQFAAKHDLKAEILPWSWWNPSGCIAVLFTTLPIGSEWPWWRKDRADIEAVPVAMRQAAKGARRDDIHARAARPSRVANVQSNRRRGDT